MNAGSLRHRIQIQAPSRASDGGGGATVTWTTINRGSCWASIVPVKGRELFQFQQLYLKVPIKIVLRYIPGVNITQRVLYGDRVFNIRSVVNEDERNRQLTLVCEEGIPG